MKYGIIFIALIILVSFGIKGYSQNPTELKLKDYRPKSIYKTPVTRIEKARYPAKDIHSHPYAETDKELAEWIKVMDAKGIQKTIILTMATGPKFDSIYSKYHR